MKKSLVLGTDISGAMISGCSAAGAELGTSSSWPRSDNSNTSQTVAAGQSDPSSNTTMLQPEKAIAAAPQRKIF